MRENSNHTEIMCWQDRLATDVLGNRAYTEDWMKEGLQMALDTLTEKEKDVILKRYRDEMTLKEIGETHNGVTREYIRQIESKALRKLKHPTRKNLILYGKEAHEIKEKAQILHEELIAKELRITQLMDQLTAYKEEIKKLDKSIKMDEKILKAVNEKAGVKTNVLVPIEDADLTVRSYNCLRRAGYKYINEVANFTYEELSNIRNLGKKSADEIIDVLISLGLRPSNKFFASVESTKES